MSGHVYCTRRALGHNYTGVSLLLSVIFLYSPFNPLIPIVPKVDLPLRTDKCDFWNHFKTFIIRTLLLFCLFRLHKIVKRR